MPPTQPGRSLDRLDDHQPAAPRLTATAGAARRANGRVWTTLWPSMVAALLAASLLRSLPLLDNRFHPDEALYASFARLIASGRDPLLAGVLVDKPPLSFYLNALSLALFGSSELAARLPNFYASLASLALLFALGRRLYGPATGQVAAWLLALSPFAILFSITLFIDPLLTALLLWGLWAAAAQRWQSLGVAVALAFAVKQTMLLFVPLLLALALCALPARATPRQGVRQLVTAARPMVIGLALSALLIFAWDAARQHPVGFWAQGYTDNVPGRFVRASEVLPRALAWVNLMHYFTASNLLNAVFAAGSLALLAIEMRRPSRAALIDVLLAGYMLVYLSAYWLLAFNVWDRYLVPLLPLLALLLARVLTRAMPAVLAWLGGRGKAPASLRRLPPWRYGIAAVALVLIVPSALTASRSGYPIGGDHGPHDGIDQAARFIQTLPEGGVLYDHWLSWQWTYYLFDSPLYVAWFPNPAALATDLAAFGATSPRYLVVPSWEADAELRTAAALAGYSFAPLYAASRRDGTTSFIVYHLRPAP